MNTPRYAASVAKLLGKHIARPQLVEGDRDRGIETINRAMQARVRRKRVYWAASGLAAAAALLLAFQGLRYVTTSPGAGPLVAINVTPAGRGAALRAVDGEHPLPGYALVGAGQRIETPTDGGASLELSTGTSMQLAGSTSFRVDSQGSVERFSLERGELSAHVAKLTTGQRFIVATPDAEVEVRGTRFRVNVLSQGEACGNGTRTRLDVTEGVVEVRHAGSAVSIRAGQHWPTDCVSSKAQTADNADTTPSDARRASSEPRPRLAPAEQPLPAAETTNAAETTSAAHPAPERASLLAQQNDLFAEGVAMRRQGDVDGALRVYQELIARFPRSPLAENARVERMRLLASRHDARASTEARLYLSRYPHGFASKEAGQLTAQP